MAKIPFDIKYRPQIESGEYKVETKDHHSVRIICWNKNTGGLDRIVALVAGGSGQEKTLSYTEEGWCVSFGKSKDLFIITPEPELTEFEKAVGEVMYGGCDVKSVLESSPIRHEVKKYASALFELARKELVKQGYVIEKKAFHDAVEKISPEVMKEVSETIDLSDFFTEIGKKYPEVPFGRVIQIGLAAYNKSKEEALKDLPRWKKAKEYIKLGPDDFCFTLDSNGKMTPYWDTEIEKGQYFITESDIENLPKED